MTLIAGDIPRARVTTAKPSSLSQGPLGIGQIHIVIMNWTGQGQLGQP